MTDEVMSSGMRLKTDVDSLRSALKEAERIQFELDLRIYHLKTLYDVSPGVSPCCYRACTPEES
jgi:hypothetical protein